MPSTKNRAKPKRQPKNKTKQKTNPRQRQVSKDAATHQTSTPASEGGNLEQAAAQPEPTYQAPFALNPSAVPAQPAHNSSQHGNFSDTPSNIQPSFDGFILARDPKSKWSNSRERGPSFQRPGGYCRHNKHWFSSGFQGG